MVKKQILVNYLNKWESNSLQFLVKLFTHKSLNYLKTKYQNNQNKYGISFYNLNRDFFLIKLILLNSLNNICKLQEDNWDSDSLLNLMDIYILGMLNLFESIFKQQNKSKEFAFYVLMILILKSNHKSILRISKIK